MAKGMIDQTIEHKPGDLVVYGLIPTDLNSLRQPNATPSKGGKVGAHGHHAGMQMLKYAQHPDVKYYVQDGMAHGADHFNTCITLDATTAQLVAIVSLAQKLGYAADMVTDPSYPFFVDSEVAKFLTSDCTVIWDVRKDNQVLVLRKAVTFGWLLGDKANDLVFTGLVGRLKLAE